MNFRKRKRRSPNIWGVALMFFTFLGIYTEGYFIDKEYQQPNEADHVGY